MLLMQIHDAFIGNNELTSHVAYMYEPTLYKTLIFAYGIKQKRRSAALTRRLNRAFIFMLPSKLQNPKCQDCSCTVWCVFDIVGNQEDRFSEAHFIFEW